MPAYHGSKQSRTCFKVQYCSGLLLPDAGLKNGNYAMSILNLDDACVWLSTHPDKCHVFSTSTLERVQSDTNVVEAITYKVHLSN